MTVTFKNPLETPTIIHLHFTGNGKGLYATMNRWRIDPSLQKLPQYLPKLFFCFLCVFKIKA